VRFTAALVALGIAGSWPSPLPARQDAPGQPIRIESCAANSRTFLLDPFNSERVNLVTGVSVRFRNVSDVAATRLTILVRYAGATESIDRSGNFAAGRLVDQTVTAFTGAPYAGAAANCRLTAAVFADGTTWNAAR
jgi:hypothetical protein